LTNGDLNEIPPREPRLPLGVSFSIGTPFRDRLVAEHKALGSGRLPNKSLLEVRFEYFPDQRVDFIIRERERVSKYLLGKLGVIGTSSAYSERGECHATGIDALSPVFTARFV
jgi:hypothetical protein